MAATTSVLDAPPLVDPLSIVDISWRADVVISSSALHPVRSNGAPLLTLNLALSDGRTLAYRMTQETLHQWRYSMAKATKDLIYLQQKAPPVAAKRHVAAR